MANVNQGIVLRAPDPSIEAEAKRHGYAVMINADLLLPFAQTLIVEPGTAVPWAMVADGLHLVERWDAAAPLTLGEDDRHVGLSSAERATETECKRTQRLVHDLRMPIYASELLFVQQGEVGVELIETWRTEMCHGPNRRLAFLRAFYLVKPKLCALPSIWVGAARERRMIGNGGRAARGYARRGAAHPNDLVRVEIKPGVYVRCRSGEEEKMLSQLTQGRRGRHGTGA